MTNMTDEQIKSQFSDRYAYFMLCRYVAIAEPSNQDTACRFLRKVMLTLGYPQETASWDDERTLMYAHNIVVMG
jgi:hypothetical protein